MKLGDVAIAQIRAVVREEARAEIERYLNPTFQELVTRGVAEMEMIFDAVNGMDDRFKDLETSVRILQAAVSTLQTER